MIKDAMTGGKAGRHIFGAFLLLAVLAAAAPPGAAQPARLGDRTMVCTLTERPAGGWVATNMVTWPPCGGGGFAQRNNAIELTYVGNAPSGYQLAVCAFDTTQPGAFLAGNADWVLVGAVTARTSCGGGANNIATLQRR